ncbi:MAG: hypothetical protein WBM16_12120, partial [Pseudolabrys sp.]
MSALPSKADMCGATRDVRFVPKADIVPDERGRQLRRGLDSKMNFSSRDMACRGRLELSSLA